MGRMCSIAGVVVETLCKGFKARSENEGKSCKTGMRRWGRHVDYLGYSLCR